MPDESGSKPVAFPDVAKLMSGKRGLIMGVANERSIAWGIAQALHAAGAELAFTYQGAAFGKRVIPMVEKLGSKIVVEADVENEQSLQALFGRLQRDWGKLDFVVHAIAFSDKEELKGRYVDTTKANFQRSLTISCYSFTEIARRALPLMTDGGSLITLTYEGATRVMPSYNVMGVAKAYVTRVGEGPFPSEIQGPDQDRMRELGGEYGTVTGRSRRCGWLDLVALRYAVRVNGITTLALTKLDVLSHFAEVPVCTRYTLRDGTDGEMEVRSRSVRIGPWEPLRSVHSGRFMSADASASEALAAERRRWIPSQIWSSE